MIAQLKQSPPARWSAELQGQAQGPVGAGEPASSDAPVSANAPVSVRASIRAGALVSAEGPLRGDAPNRASAPLSAGAFDRVPAPLHVSAMPRFSMSALAVGAFGFFAFMPYPALPVGGASAVQFGDMLTILMVLACIALPWKRRAFWVYPLILAPLCLATLKVAMTGEGDVLLCFKALAGSVLSCLSIVTAQLYAPAYSLELLTGIAIATLVHVAVGMWQLYGFSTGQFPLLSLYVNPSFLSVQNDADTIVKYIRRPFGLFPEPSAMSSSLAPWVVLWTALSCGIIRLRRSPSRWQQWLFATAAAGGLGLIILSQSGHTIVTLAALVPIAVLWVVQARATVGSSIAIMLAFGIVLPLIVWFAAIQLSGRMGGAELGNSSWEERADSLRVGFELLFDGGLATALFGMGPGMSAPALWRHAHLEAVWSVLLTYIYETGFIGALLVCWIAQHLARIWKSSHFDITFGAFVFVWLVGITLTTSYSQLLPIWIALGWLTVWPSVISPAGREKWANESLRSQYGPARVPSAPAWTGSNTLPAGESGMRATPPSEAPLWPSRLGRRPDVGRGPA
ncbi:MAG TPA: hypothetical protein VFC78_20145 [Tepidisphaeraceae bacterium]|nr:hypothetical protein [Tepidisphaeraceae bacterium]